MWLFLLETTFFMAGGGNLNILPILMVATLITYIGGRILEKYKEKWIYILFFVLNITVLLVFKYTNFTIENINLLGTRISDVFIPLSLKNMILPVGLSFYIFQSITYLGDVYRKGMKAEKNLLRYAAFVSFFPTILSGPIQKSRELLPQLREPAEFNFECAYKGLILFIWGMFEKICVANNLSQIVSIVFDNYKSYHQTNTSYYIVAGISFSLYIYADFSSYSDMARGLSKFLGIEIKKNFDNPYLSTNLSEFWRRWHISLNDWFIENIYIPLGGNRKGSIRKHFNIFIIFFISGIWHGASWNFVVWGVVNGILVIIGNIVRPLKRRIYKFLKIDESLETIVFIRRIIVFWIITLTWIFFRNDVQASVHIIRRMIMFSPVRLFVPELLTICGTEIRTVITLLFVIIFCIIQYSRKDEIKYYTVFRKQPAFIQCFILSLVICVSIYVASASNVTLNTEFLYFKF